MPRLEIIACTLEDALAAQAGGADSLELCIDLHLEGLSPSIDLVKAIQAQVTLPLNVMVRPHADSFVYSEADREWIRAYVDAIGPFKVHTLVFGAQTPEGFLDVPLIQQVAAWAATTPLTLHRALDSAKDPKAALTLLIGQVKRVLTSGPAPSAWEGRSILKQWMAELGTHFTFALAGGITLETIQPLHEAVHAAEYHVGSAARSNGVVDQAKVTQLKMRLDH